MHAHQVLQHLDDPVAALREIDREAYREVESSLTELQAKIQEQRDAIAFYRGIVSPATPRIYRQAMTEGLIDVFMQAGFCVTNPTCGACLGMSNGVLAEGEVCAATTNRNFNGRMGIGGMVHLVSPATAAASAIAGHLAAARNNRKQGV